MEEVVVVVLVVDGWCCWKGLGTHGRIPPSKDDKWLWVRFGEWVERGKYGEACP